MRKVAALAVLGGTGACLLYAYYAFYQPDPARFPIQGIDVSHHQGPIDWPKVAKSNVAFAYIKATEGGDFRDKRFGDNWKDAKAAGIVRGAYHFYTLCRAASFQAANFSAVVPREAGALPPALDLEFGGNCAARPAVEAVKSELGQFSDAIFAAYGVRPVLYVTRDFLKAYGDALPEHSGLWIRSIAWAPYRSEGPWVFWQYHNRGSVTGIQGPVDRNVFHADREAFAAHLTSGK